jgi:hypothetical protein
VENAVSGRTVEVPVYLKIQNGSNLSGLQFLAHVLPSSGAPAITTPAQFVLNSGMPVGRPVDGLAPNQVAYAWDLGAFSSPLQGNVLLGHVQFTVPATAQAGQSYTIGFGNADGAPDLKTQFDFETFPGGVWVNGPARAPQAIISDEWKIKFFGSVDSPLADPNADPDHDGSPNWQEYLTGTDPTNPDSHLHLGVPQQRVIQGKKQLALDWLSAPGKTYVIETTGDLGSGNWSPLTSGVVGDGYVKEFLDANAHNHTQYYRVRLQN